MLTKPPTAIPFESIDPVLTPQGHRIRPLVDGRQEGNAPEIGICAGGLDVPAGFTRREPRTGRGGPPPGM